MVIILGSDGLVLFFFFSRKAILNIMLTVRCWSGYIVLPFTLSGVSRHVTWLLGTPGKMSKRRKVHPFFSFNFIPFIFTSIQFCIHTCNWIHRPHVKTRGQSVGVDSPSARLRSTCLYLMIWLTGPLILNLLNWWATLFFYKSNCLWGLWNVRFHKNWSKDSRHVVYLAFL